MKPDYRGFAEWCVICGCWSGTNLGGFEIEKAALRFGIIKRVPYCPETHLRFAFVETQNDQRRKAYR